MGDNMTVMVRAYIRRRVELREVKPVTAKRMRGTLLGFAAAYGERPPRNLARLDVERWMRTRQHLAIGSLRLEVTVVRAFVRWLRTEGVVRRDPMRELRNPRTPRAVPRSLRVEEVAALLAVLPDPRATAIVMLMLGLGLRRAEVAGAQCGDWDQTTDTLIVTGKGGHSRMLPMPARVAQSLHAYRSRWSSGPLIQRTDGLGPITPSHISSLMHTWMTEAGIKSGAHDGKACHSLRHTLATNVADVESDLRVIQQILGHASLTSTQVYIRGVEAARLRTALESVA